MAASLYPLHKTAKDAYQAALTTTDVLVEVADDVRVEMPQPWRLHSMRPGVLTYVHPGHQAAAIAVLESE